jgi:hypothetical protein
MWKKQRENIRKLNQGNILGKKSIEEFKYLLNKESWQEVFQTSELNSALQVFMDIFGYYFNIAFPCELKNLNKTYNSKWITKGIKVSCKRVRFF